MAQARRVYPDQAARRRLYRLVYEVIDRRLVVVVIAVGRRDHDAVYLQASGRSRGP